LTQILSRNLLMLSVILCLPEAEFTEAFVAITANTVQKTNLCKGGFYLQLAVCLAL
jgi:hypothetical protein